MSKNKYVVSLKETVQSKKFYDSKILFDNDRELSDFLAHYDSGRFLVTNIQVLGECENWVKDIQRAVKKDPDLEQGR